MDKRREREQKIIAVDSENKTFVKTFSKDVYLFPLCGKFF